jgi:hypothetical protein
MKIELKNIKINLRFSEETIMFMADLYVNGIKVANAKNDGHGGNTYYHPCIGKTSLLEEAEEYAKNLPSIKYETFVIESNLEIFIDQLINDFVNKKENEKQKRKIEKLTLNHIVWGIPNAASYNLISFKGKPMFDSLKLTPQGNLALNNLLDKIKSELKEGEVIFNQNL